MATGLVFATLCLLNCLFSSATGSSLSVNENKLRDALFNFRTPLDSHSRPVNSHEDRIQVHVQMAVNYIIDLDERKQVLVLSSLMTYEWLDNRLKWNPRDFGGVEGIHANKDIIWTPDLIPYNSVNASNLNIYTNTLLKVHFTGRVTWLTPATTHTTCDLDLSRFPFDQHLCSVKIGSWTYHGWAVQPILKSSQILFTNKSSTRDVDTIGLGRYQSHHEWQVSNGNAVLEDKYYDCCKEPYPTITFNLTLKRTWSSYVFTSIIPSILPFTILLSMFCLPPTNSDKVILSAFLFLYQLILSQYFHWTVPKNGSAVPRIVVFCGSCTVLVGVVLIVFSVTYILSSGRHRSGIPRPLKGLFSGWMGKVLCLRLSRIQLGSKDGTTPAVDCNRTILETRNDQDWQTLSEAIERVFLTFFVALIAILLAVTLI